MWVIHFNDLLYILLIFMFFGSLYTLAAALSEANSSLSGAVYTNYFYDTSVIFSNFIIKYKEPFIGRT